MLGAFRLSGFGKDRWADPRGRGPIGQRSCAAGRPGRCIGATFAATLSVQLIFGECGASSPPLIAIGVGVGNEDARPLVRPQTRDGVAAIGFEIVGKPPEPAVGTSPRSLVHLPKKASAPDRVRRRFSPTGRPHNRPRRHRTPPGCWRRALATSSSQDWRPSGSRPRQKREQQTPRSWASHVWTAPSGSGLRRGHPARQFRETMRKPGWRM